MTAFLPANGVVIGVSTIIFYNRLRGGKVGIIEDVIVDSKFRNSGYGEKLIRATLDKAIKKRAYKIMLESSDKAESLYLRVGLNKGGSIMKTFT